MDPVCWTGYRGPDRVSYHLPLTDVPVPQLPEGLLMTGQRPEHPPAVEASRSHFSQQSMALLDPANQDRLTNPLSAGLAA